MSGEQPERPIGAAPTEADPADLPRPDPDPPAPRGPLNALAVVSVALGVLLSPVAAVFGHIALGQITRSRRPGGRNERGRRVAGTAIALGWLWLVGYLIGGAAVWVALGGIA